MTYAVKEIFYTLQGEGFHTGRPAVFLRFAGCNLWTGREEDRATAVCKFCDTDFVGIGPDGGKFATADDLADAVASRWPCGRRRRQPAVCRLHRRRAAAAARCGRDRRAARARIRGRGRNERHAAGAARARLDLCQPEDRRAARAARAATNSSSCIRRTAASPSSSSSSISVIFSCSRWTVRSRRGTRRWQSSIA